VSEYAIPTTRRTTHCPSCILAHKSHQPTMKEALILLLITSIFLLDYRVEGGSIRKVQAKPALKPLISLQLIATHVLPHKCVMNLTFSGVNTIDLQKLGLSTASFNIKVLANATVKSIKFSNGMVENSLPFAYCGNSGDV
jgi:hypothetical protein